MPTVGWVRERYIGSLVESVVDILLDDAWFAYCLASQKHDFDFGPTCDRTGYGIAHLNTNYK